MEIGICPFQDHFNQKWHFHFLIHWVLLKYPIVNIWKNSKNSYFSDFEHIFLLFGGVFSKCTFYENKFFWPELFLRPIFTWENTPNRFFWFFFSFVKYLFKIFVFIWVSFCRTGKMSVLRLFFLKSRGFVWPNLIRYLQFFNWSWPIGSSGLQKHFTQALEKFFGYFLAPLF